MAGTYYGNSSNGYGYSPNRAYDVDRFNPSTQGNYTNPNLEKLTAKTIYESNYQCNFYK